MGNGSEHRFEDVTLKLVLEPFESKSSSAGGQRARLFRPKLSSGNMTNCRTHVYQCQHQGFLKIICVQGYSEMFP